MLKPEGFVRARRNFRRLRSADLPDAVEGQIAEICRDLAIQAKRMRDLQERADELRMVIHQWARRSEPDSHQPANRGGRR